jgi:gliding motility-associated-like protein
MIIQSQRSCFGQSENSLIVQASGGTGNNYVYLWSNQIETITNNQLAAGVYSVTVTDEAGCTHVSSATAVDLEPITAVLSQTPPACFGEMSGSIEVISLTGGSGMDNLANYTATWSTIPIQSGYIASGLNGSSSYQVTVTDSSGCSAIFTEFLNEPQQIQVELDINPVSCSGAQDGMLSIIQTSGGVGTISYQWDPLLGGGQQTTLTNVAAGSYVLRLEDTNACIRDTLISVNEPLPISIQFLQILEPKCAGDTNGQIEATATGGNGGFFYSWNNGSNSEENTMIGAGLHVVTVTDIQGCTNTAELMLQEPEPLIFDLAFKNPDCSNKSNGEIEVVAMGGSVPYQYALNNGPYQSSPVFGPLAQGSYLVSLRDVNGCLFTETTGLENPDAITIDLGDDVTINLGESVNLQATITGPPPTSIIWKAPYDGTLSCLDCLNPTSMPKFTITYTVIGTSEKGCETSDNITVFVIPKRTVLIPTAFTPNGDGSNDLLLVHGVEGILIKSFQVFDRWGEKLFETSNFLINNSNIGWDGTFRGGEMNSGVYIWTLEVEHLDGLSETLSGQTTLIR